jgi:hypothetical protein
MRIKLNELLEALLTAEYEFREAQVNSGVHVSKDEMAARCKYENAVIDLRNAINNTCARDKNSCKAFW